MIINEMPGIGLDNTTATAANILSGYTAYNGDADKLTGTMANNGAYTATTSYGGSVIIPAGYHNGSGKITGATFSFSGDAAASNVLSGKTFYSNSTTKQTGSMANQGTKTSSLNCGQTYTIPQGYHSGSGVITANSLASQTSATATADKILSGYTAWVNGSKITGTLAAKNFAYGTLIATPYGSTDYATSLSFSVNFTPTYLIATTRWTGSYSPTEYADVNPYVFGVAYVNGNVYATGVLGSYSSCEIEIRAISVRASVYSSSIYFTSATSSDLRFLAGSTALWHYLYAA